MSREMYEAAATGEQVRLETVAIDEPGFQLRREVDTERRLETGGHRFLPGELHFELSVDREIEAHREPLTRKTARDFSFGVEHRKTNELGDILIEFHGVSA